VPRLLAGILVALVTLATATLYAFGVWNPWHYVVLMEHFNNPWIGTMIVCGGIYLSLWLLTPIRNEARQPWRIWARAFTAMIAVLGFVAWGLTSQLFAYEATEMANSADGQRTVVDVTAGSFNERSIRVWEGAGLLKREIASFGKPCGSVRAEFASPDVVVVNQGHGDWEFHLDPDTGQPLHVFGPRCSDGPTPATMGG
jgi:hypothetical protein